MNANFLKNKTSFESFSSVLIGGQTQNRNKKEMLTYLDHPGHEEQH